MFRVLTPWKFAGRFVSIFRDEDGDRMFFRLCLSVNLHGVKSQNSVILSH